MVFHKRLLPALTGGLAGFKQGGWAGAGMGALAGAFTGTAIGPPGYRPFAPTAPSFASAVGAAPSVRYRGKPNTKTGMVAMPAKLPTERQWKRIDKRLHSYRAVSIRIVNRTGGMRRGYGGRRRYSQRRSWGRRR